MPNLAILTNGGDTCALNASIEAIRKEAHRIGFGRVIGIIGGYHGLLHDNCQTLNAAVDEQRGGSILRSLRESPVHLSNGKYRIDRNKVNRMVKTLKDRDIDVLVVIGGDGTLQATKLFHQAVQEKHQFKIMGFPKTIDNDIRTKTHFEGIEVSLCPGYPTAARNIAQATKAIRTTALSAQRVFGVETMGRDAGWLAAAAEEGGPDMILIPEVPLDEKAKRRLIARTKKTFNLNLHAVIVVSEGTKWANEKGDIVQISTDEFGPRKLGGVVNTVMQFIDKKLRGQFTESKPFGVRPHHTDYVPRAGSPCEYDLKLVHVLAEKLGTLLTSRKYGRVPILRAVVPYDELSVQHTGDLDIEEMEQKLFPADDLYDEKRFLPNKTFVDFLCTILSGPDTER
ncbi:MAG: 6-phosphofructokinase [Acidobacteriota bacterium]|nr:6-phosphofructokinase [Acidobacteriota bacterium]MDQ5835436.1 6-phosphofructokinase [Acidobacteriota bacterium]